MTQVLLLKWLTLHHNCVRTDSPLFLRNFSTGVWALASSKMLSVYESCLSIYDSCLSIYDPDLKDSRVLAAAIISHVPSKKLSLDRIKEVTEAHDSEEGAKQLLKNAKILLACLQDLQMVDKFSIQERKKNTKFSFPLKLPQAMHGK
jgi:hypothetical protein